MSIDIPASLLNPWFNTGEKKALENLTDYIVNDLVDASLEIIQQDLTELSNEVTTITDDLYPPDGSPNLVFATPNGGIGGPGSFRALVAADLPDQYIPTVTDWNVEDGVDGDMEVQPTNANRNLNLATDNLSGTGVVNIGRSRSRRVVRTLAATTVDLVGGTGEDSYAGCVVVSNLASPVTLTITDQDWSIGDSFVVFLRNASGSMVVTPGVGVTMTGGWFDGDVYINNGRSVEFICTGTNVWSARAHSLYDLMEYNEPDGAPSDPGYILRVGVNEGVYPGRLPEPVTLNVGSSGGTTSYSNIFDFPRRHIITGSNGTVIFPCGTDYDWYVGVEHEVIIAESGAVADIMLGDLDVTGKTLIAVNESGTALTTISANGTHLYRLSGLGKSCTIVQLTSSLWLVRGNVTYVA